MLKISVLFLVYFLVDIRGSSAVSQEISEENVVWTWDKAVDIVVGPEDAVYCKVQDPLGYTVYDEFGRCKIKVDSVQYIHRGTWKMLVGVPGRISPQEHRLKVDVRAAESGPVVTTSVLSNEPSVLLTCSVPAQYEVQACMFRNPHGRILLAQHGVGEDGYTFKESHVSYEAEAQSHDCILRITNPSVQDLGIWNCAVDTDQDTYYGYMTVLSPWLMHDEDVAASIVTEPVLKTYVSIDSLVGEPVQMSCSIDSAIRYCYFRADNGTIFNVGPSISSSQYEYVGRGLDAGDCGIRFSSLMATPSFPMDWTTWSCHVGMVNTAADEQRVNISVRIREKISVYSYWMGNVGMSSIEVGGKIPNSPPLDYCRFVRIDGLGFSSHNWPPGYEVRTQLHEGVYACILNIPNPNNLDLQPWTVVAKITGVNGEVSKSTDPLYIPPVENRMPLSYAVFLWVFIIVLCILVIGVSMAFVPKKNREWTYNRASQFRNSFRKQPLPNDILTDLPRKG